MKRVLFVHHVSVIGGASYCMLNLLKNIDRSYIYPIVLLAEPGPLSHELDKLGIEIIYLRKLTTVPYNRSMFAWDSIPTYYYMHCSLQPFKEVLIRNNIDIVYLNNVMLYPYLKPSKEAGMKTIIHIREHWPKNEHKIQLSWLQNDIRKYADHVVSINEYGATLVPGISHKLSIVYDWIDFSNRYECRPMSTIIGEDASNKKVFVFTGGNSQWKGAAEVVEAFSRNVKDSDLRLLMIGTDGSFPLLGISGFVKRILSFFGYKSYQSRFVEAVSSDNRIICIPATYKLKHILEQSYAMLSYFTIPHANLALAEAIALGLPTIAAETEESLEYTNGGIGAKLFEINNMDDFIKSIHWLIANYDFQKSRTLSISDSIKAKFDKENNVCIFNNLLRSI